jgi:hypothetical protein
MTTLHLRFTMKHIFAAILAGLLTCATTDAADYWVDLFDGSTLDGWEANIAPKSFSVVDGAICAHATTKKKSHLFFTGEGSSYRNFELVATVRAAPHSNGGIFFHTDSSTRDRHMHLANGYEVQLNSSQSEKQKTGSLYAIVDFHQSPVDETEWFEVGITVRGKRIVVKLNGRTVVDYVEPDSPVREKSRKGRLLSKTGGKIALQAHDRKSRWYFREIKIRRL